MLQDTELNKYPTEQVPNCFLSTDGSLTSTTARVYFSNKASFLHLSEESWFYQNKRQVHSTVWNTIKTTRHNWLTRKIKKKKHLVK